MSFPTTGILDTGNRPDEGPPPSSSWLSVSPNSATPTLAVSSNVFVSTGGLNDGGVWGSVVGPDSEVFFTLVACPFNGQLSEVFCRCANVGTSSLNGYKLTVTRADANPGFNFAISQITNDVVTQLGATVNESGGAFAGGEKFGLSAVGGTLTGYINRSGVWTPVLDRADGTYAATGYLGLRLASFNIHGSDFGGGTVPLPSVMVPHSTSPALLG